MAITRALLLVSAAGLSSTGGSLEAAGLALASTVLVAASLVAVLAAFALRTPHSMGTLWLATATLLLPTLIAAPAQLIFAVPALATLVVVKLTGTRDGVERSWLCLLALALVSASADRHRVVASLTPAPDDIATVLAAVALPVLALWPSISRGLASRIAIALALATYALIGVALVSGKGYHSDAVVAVHRAAEHVLAGADPYRSFDMAEALDRFGLSRDLATNFRDGSLLRTFNYPALAFLVPAPLVALGLDDVRWVYLSEVLAIALLVLAAAPRAMRPLAIATLVGCTPILRQFVLAGVDPAWVLLVALAWLTFERGAISAIVCGLALAARQTAWPVGLLYVIWTWHERGRRAALGRASLVALAALVPNLPFLIGSPAAFLGGISDPLLQPLEVHGVGPSRFAADVGAAPIGFLLATAATFAALVWWASRRPEIARAGVALGPLPLFLSWRALVSYVAFAPALGWLGLLPNERGSGLAGPSETTSLEQVASLPGAPTPGAAGHVLEKLEATTEGDAEPWP